MYRKLKRVWSRLDYSSIPNFKKVFPEIKHLDHDELCERWSSLGVTLYTENISPVNKWVRFTLPIALLVMFLMFVSLPFLFLITGEWSYSLGKNSRILNWFKSLRLVS
jgi:hypothetical protein